MSLFRDIRMYARYMSGLWSFLRQPMISWEDAVAAIQRRLDQREDNFLRLIERGVYRNSPSPYRRLLDLAQCDLADIRDLVRRRGLEHALRELHDAGVYVTFEEFKGRTPIVRSGHEIAITAADFDNPFPASGYYVETGGSTGAGTRVPTDLAFFRERASQAMVTQSVHGALGAQWALWRGPLPDPTGFNLILAATRYERTAPRWFTPIAPGDMHVAFKHRLAATYTTLTARLAGFPFPHPELVTTEQANIIAQWMADVLRREGRCAFHGPIARHMHLSLAAVEEGLDLTGAIMFDAGEPPTPAKVDVIRRSGARHVSNYWFSEGGQIGTACVNPVDTNDIHFFEDMLALIQSPRTYPGSDVPLDMFCFTSLALTAPKILLNVEIDDFGVVEKRSCGCPLHDLGFTRHLRHIQSAAKLTGEGVTLVGSDMARILTEVLPKRFGGTPLDYQICEEEDPNGFTRLGIVVSPKVTLVDETGVIDAVLAELHASNTMADIAQANWVAGEAFRILRREPYTTPRGKQPVLHVARRTQQTSDR